MKNNHNDGKGFKDFIKKNERRIKACAVAGVAIGGMSIAFVLGCRTGVRGIATVLYLNDRELYDRACEVLNKSSK